MVVRPTPFRHVDPDDVKGTAWERYMGQAQEAAGSEATMTHIVDLVNNGNITLAAGETLDTELNGYWRVMSFLVDIAPDVDATVYIDGNARFSTADRLGLGGAFRLGDGVTTYMPMRSVRIVATNQGGSSRDVRAWMVAA